jgi:hypothetical protein
MNKTGWFPAAQRPRRPGMYEVQTPHTSCRCCWEEADYRDGKWWRYGKHCTLSVRVEVDVTHWRGLAEKPSNQKVGG